MPSPIRMPSARRLNGRICPRRLSAPSWEKTHQKVMSWQWCTPPASTTSQRPEASSARAGRPRSASSRRRRRRCRPGRPGRAGWRCARRPGWAPGRSADSGLLGPELVGERVTDRHQPDVADVGQRAGAASPPAGRRCAPAGRGGPDRREVAAPAQDHAHPVAGHGVEPAGVVEGGGRRLEGQQLIGLGVGRPPPA